MCLTYTQVISRVCFKRALRKEFFLKLECSVFDPLFVIASVLLHIMHLRELKRETFLGRRLPINNYWEWLDDALKVKIWKMKTEMEIRDLRPKLVKEVIRYANEKVYKKKMQQPWIE